MCYWCHVWHMCYWCHVWRMCYWCHVWRMCYWCHVWLVFFIYLFDVMYGMCCVHVFLTPQLQQFKKALQGTHTDINDKTSSGNAVIHSVIERTFGNRRERVEFLLTLLTYTHADVNLTNGNQMTPLHLASQVDK